MSFYVKKLEKSECCILFIRVLTILNIILALKLNQIIFLDVTGRGVGLNKQTASKNCALFLVRELYHLGVIEAFSENSKTNKETNIMKPYPVKICSKLIDEINSTLKELQITPVKINKVNIIFCNFILLN